MFKRRCAYAWYFIFGLCAGSYQVTAAEPLSIGLGDVDYGPFYYSRNDRTTGISIEIVEQVLASIEQPYVIKRRAWTRLLSELEAGQVDLVTVIYENQERLPKFQYVHPAYLLDMISLLCASPCPINYQGKLESVAPHYIGVVRNYSYGQVIDGNYSFQRQEIENEKLLFKLMQLGKLELALAAKSRHRWFSRSYGPSKQIEALADVEPIPVYFAFSPLVDKALVDKFTAALEPYLHSDSYQSLLKKYQMQSFSITHSPTQEQNGN
ncbi:transporter substrate-binding domain-containing protein [Aliiglaciecola sp. CAU 1673]|uniref:substrate-binding periplasmic protein n=1 Tax=Aliiglaciecola sp. CAU 1673 TaxID=3032595 RepID=UPI0023DA175B|nr:transporter substrate-binding domain-containing protein [Aliiglaciecola sp. CAU 1673]MDF2176949.1 transporter substrate-binding domain-containing protein [Aliiglaciecola sp. CAU 1673]